MSGTSSKSFVGATVILLTCEVTAGVWTPSIINCTGPPDGFFGIGKIMVVCMTVGTT